MMQAYVLKPANCTFLLQYPAYVKARDEFKKRLDSIWILEVNCRPSSGEWRTVRGRKFWGRVFCRDSVLEAMTCGPSDPRLRTVRSSADSPARSPAKTAATVSSAVVSMGS